MIMNYLTMASKDQPRTMVITFHTVLFLTTCGADVRHKENLCELFQYVDFLSFHLLSVKF